MNTLKQACVVFLSLIMLAACAHRPEYSETTLTKGQSDEAQLINRLQATINEFDSVSETEISITTSEQTGKAITVSITTETSEPLTDKQKEGIVNIIAASIDDVEADNIHFAENYKSPADMGKQLPEQVTYNAEKGVLSISVPRDIPKGYMPYFYVSGRVKTGNEIADWNAFLEQSDAVNWEFGKTFTAELAADSIDKVIIETGLLYDNSAILEYKYYVIIGEGGTMEVSDKEPVQE